jgi:hypothetical protein
MFLTEEINWVYQLSILIASLGMIIATLEDLVTRKDFGNDGLISWNISRRIHPPSKNKSLTKIFDYLLDYPIFIRGLYIRLFTSIILFSLALFSLSSSFLLGVLVFLLALVPIRNTAGNDGASQLYIILYASLFIGVLFSHYPFIMQGSLIFISLNLLLCYFISGASKLLSPMWRSGEALVKVTSCYTYSFEGVYQLVSRFPAIGLLICWFTIIWETFFFLVLFTDTNTTLYFLAVGFLFHLGVAIFMGLNNFLFVFSATYPSVYFTILQLENTGFNSYFLN